MAGYGTGRPHAFICPVARRNRRLWSDSERPGELPRGHERIVRTGRTKPRRHDGNLHPRILPTSHEYRCECGHVGWTTHNQILYYPVEENERSEP